MLPSACTPYRHRVNLEGGLPAPAASTTPSRPSPRPLTRRTQSDTGALSVAQASHAELNPETGRRVNAVFARCPPRQCARTKTAASRCECRAHLPPETIVSNCDNFRFALPCPARRGGSRSSGQRSQRTPGPRCRQRSDRSSRWSGWRNLRRQPFQCRSRCFGSPETSAVG
jgi:hypothetical protein